MICLWSGPPGFTCWTSVAPESRSRFGVEYSFCFISVMNLYLHVYVRWFDSLMNRGPSRGANDFYMYMNHIRT